jgi:hypothetical protein
MPRDPEEPTVRPVWLIEAGVYGAEADPLLADNPEYLALAESPARRQQLWREFLLADDPREEAVRRGDWTIGDDDFRRRALLAQGRPAPRRRGRPRKEATAELSISPQVELDVELP